MNTFLLSILIGISAHTILLCPTACAFSAPSRGVALGKGLVMKNKQHLHEKLVKLLGSEKVLVEDDALLPYKINTMGLPKSLGDNLISGVLLPSTTQDVADIIEFANQELIPLYPISKGRNWGCGSKLPSFTGAYIVDLGNMNRIREVNEETGYAIVEPGVTHEDLIIELKNRGSRFMIDKTGAPCTTSIIGNTMERGWGLKGSKIDLLNCMEIVLGSGELLRTGIWERGAPFVCHRVGPVSDHLFTQSNLGIVTAISYKLLPRPEKGNVLFCSVDRENIQAFWDALKVIKEFDSETKIKFFYDRKYFVSDDSPMIATLFTFGKANMLKVRTENILEAIGDKAGVSVREDVWSPQARSDSMEDIVGALVHPDSGSEIDVSKVMFSQFTEVSTPSGDNLDEVEDFGLCFFDMVIPFDSAEVKKTVEYVTEVVGKKYDISRRVTFHAYEHDFLVAVVYMVFNRKDEDAVARARECLDELYGNREINGLRLTPFHMDKDRKDKEYLRGIKNAFDPNGIIAPGRYIV